MLRLFRRLRKRLINEKKAGKYFLYAFGEVIILIFGILIALQVNNWNEKRQKQDLESVILLAIKADLDKDLINCKNDILIHKLQVNSSNIILDHINNDLTYNDSLSSHFLETCSYTITTYNNASFETLKSLGVGLISNVELRNEIIYMYDSHQYFLSEMRRTIPDQVSFAYKTLFATRFEEGLNYSLKLGDDLQSIVDSNDELGSMVPLNFEILKKDTEYIYFLKTLKNSNELYLDALYDFKTKLSSLFLVLQYSFPLGY